MDPSSMPRDPREITEVPISDAAGGRPNPGSRELETSVRGALVEVDAREFCARLDPQRAIHPRQVRLDRVDADEQRVGDLSVRLPGRGELSDPSLGLCER